jgi:predicted enzyme related to lactoylglutathione lyase
MAMEGESWGEIPDHWMAYVAVADIEATAAKVEGLGGKVCVPVTDIGIGRFAVINDPVGAYLSVFQGA